VGVRLFDLVWGKQKSKHFPNINGGKIGGKKAHFNIDEASLREVPQNRVLAKKCSAVQRTATALAGANSLKLLPRVYSKPPALSTRQNISNSTAMMTRGKGRSRDRVAKKARKQRLDTQPETPEEIEEKRKRDQAAAKKRRAASSECYLHTQRPPPSTFG
jgi:hypothetical protein